MKKIRYPSIYQINTRVYLNELSQQLGRKALINDISDEEILKLKEKVSVICG